MSNTMGAFSKGEITILKNVFSELEAVCMPNKLWLQPILTTERVSDLSPMDKFHLPNRAFDDTIDVTSWWFNKDFRLTHRISEIKTPKSVWYYSMLSFPSFFSGDGEKKATLKFHYYPPDDAVILRTKGVKQALKSAFARLDGSDISDYRSTADCFPESVCRRIFEKTYPRERAIIPIIKMIEYLRQILRSKLSQNHTNEISKLPEFQQYLSSLHSDTLRQFGQDTVLQIAGFLDNPKYKLKNFELGEKFGYIQESRRLNKYQQLRNYERHQDVETSVYWSPQIAYDDFKTVLGFPRFWNNTRNPFVLAERNIDIYNAMRKGQILLHKIEKKAGVPEPQKLDNYGNPKKSKKYWNQVFQTMTNNGDMTDDLVQSVQAVRDDARMLAHVTTGFKDAQDRLENGCVIVDDWLESFTLEELQDHVNRLAVQGISEEYVQGAQWDIDVRSTFVPKRQNLRLWDTIAQNQGNQR